MDKSTDAYMSFTNIVGRKIKRSVVFILLMTVGAGVFGGLVPGGFIPEEDMGYFYVNIQLPNAASLQRTGAISEEIEEILMEYPEVQFVLNATGYSMLSGSNIPNNGFMFVTLHELVRKRHYRKGNDSKSKCRLGSEIKGAQVFAFGPPAIPGLGNGSGFSIMLQDKGGNDPNYLAQNTMKFLQAANARPEIGSAFTTFQANVPQRFMDIDKEKALKLGIKLNDLYTTVGAFMGGTYVNDFTRFGRLYKTYIQAEPEYRVDESQISNFFIKNNKDEMVPLGTVATVTPTSGPDYTNRFNLFRSVEVTGGPAEGFTSNQAREALKEVAEEVLPADMNYAWNAMSFQEEKASGSLMMILTFSLVFVFLILSAQYESWSLPFSILLGTPFAIFGALFALWAARFFSPTFENNIFAQVSFVMLIGMAAKNAILIVEFANDEFKKGLSLFDAAMAASKSRFRPILMTAFSFILGVFPLVIASGSGAEARKVMGMALLGRNEFGNVSRGFLISDVIHFYRKAFWL